MAHHAANLLLPQLKRGKSLKSEDLRLYRKPAEVIDIDEARKTFRELKKTAAPNPKALPRFS
ncbi:MAG: hypothetical protein ACFB50_10825 [Rubrobacteraceae bacterium]